MAGDWLKIDKETPEKPEILLLSEILGVDSDIVFAKCFRVWRWADSHSHDGRLTGATLKTVDRIAGHEGFANALQQVGWLQVAPDLSEPALLIPHFERHMGRGAKSRLLASRRQRRKRSREPDTPPVTHERDKSVTREEKRIEENSKGGETPPLEPPSAADEPPRSRKPRKPRPRDELFDAIVEISGCDPSLRPVGSHVGRVCGTLREADPPYGPAEVRRLPEALIAHGKTFPVTVGVVESWIYLVRRDPPRKADPLTTQILDSVQRFIARGETA